MPMTRLDRWTLGTALGAAISLAMCSQNALLLIVDRATGEKHRVSRLPGLLGLAQESPLAAVVNLRARPGWY